MRCDACGRTLTEPGALVFGPPSPLGDVDVVAKYHLCVLCWGSHCTTHISWVAWARSAQELPEGYYRIEGFEAGRPFLMPG